LKFLAVGAVIGRAYSIQNFSKWINH